jgi:hypothetical protein
LSKRHVLKNKRDASLQRRQREGSDDTHQVEHPTRLPPISVRSKPRIRPPQVLDVVADLLLSRHKQHAALVRRIQGHFNYFGVNGNVPALRKVAGEVQRAWFKWLNRRSQRARLTWERFGDLLRDFPLPVPRVVVNIWKGAR